MQVKHYYFYLYDADFGQGFTKVRSYVLYPIKVYLNGHEWAKQQLHKAEIRLFNLLWIKREHSSRVVVYKD